ncbi:fas-binding factor 1 isoform X2 [Pseudophryne corroboree]|uniref:fas-binding factor 1 isoform X2 n=1 Tax=Pseudophryne corroboree TaxID=495146 RepID=UPI0030816DE1
MPKQSPSKPRKAPPLATAPARKSRPSTTKKSPLDDAFFSQLAQEAAQESDVSEADPQALLESLKDLDDMDAEIFGSKKPKSAPAKDSGMGQITGNDLKPQDKATGAKRGNSAPESEKKPLSAPAGPARPYKKYSFDDINDPLDGILSDEDNDFSKKTKTAKQKSVPDPAPVKTTAVPGNSSVVSPKRHLPSSRKKDELNFEEDTDDIMDALGFRDGPQSPQKEESSAPRPARSKLDELLGRGTAAKLLERPPTGDKKEFKLDPKYQKMAEKEDPLDNEDFAFGSYQPTMSFSPEGRPSRRSSVRFSADGNESLKSDARSRSTTPVARSPAQVEKSGADWLGLKDDVPYLTPSVPLSEPSKSTTGAPSSAGRATIATKVDNRPTLQPRANLIETPTVQKDDDWLSSSLSRKKAQIHEKVEDRKEQNLNALNETSGNSGQAVNTPQQSDPGKIVRESIPAEAEVSRTTLPWDSPVKISASTTAAAAMQKENRGKAHSSGPSDPHRDQSRVQPVPVPFREPDMEVLQSQNQLLDLKAQVRKLQRELEQQNLLLETLQQRHKEDLELIENAHRNRLKLLEDSASQREERLRLENQELSAQYLARCHSAEGEKAEMLAQYQRKLTEFQQEKDGEIERIRELQRLSVQDMRRDHEEQLQRIKRLKDQEIDAVTSASSHTRSLNGIIEQMESFSHKLSDLSVRVESTQINTTQEIELGVRQREGQLRALQERLTQQQKDMEEERNSLRMIITNMETRLNEQSRLLEQEHWRVSAEQAKMESIQRSLEEQRRIMTQQMAMEREELERAKSALLEEQQLVMTRCAEERRKLAAEWSEFHTQQKLSKERAEKDISRVIMVDSHREGAIISLAKEQAEMKVLANELRNKEEQLALAREVLEKERQDLRLEKERVNASALRVRQRAEEIESMSKLASQRHEEGEKALDEAKRVESEHLDRLRTIQQQLEWLKQQEEHMHQARKNLADQRRQLSQLQQGLPTMHSLLANRHLESQQSTALSESFHLNGVSLAVPNATLANPESQQSRGPQTSDFHAKLALLKISAQQDKDFLEDEQIFLEALKKCNISCSHTV